MTEVRLKVIPPPEEGTRAVLQGKSLPIIKGPGQYTYLCGNCGAVLIEGVDEGQVRDIVIPCPRCGRYNEIA
jgi:DNA-directed RNA polymerase subunit RPC12/RpoP